MFDGTNLTLISGVDQDKLMFGSPKDPLFIGVSSSSTYKSRYKWEIKTKIRTQQYIQMHIGVKEIQQLNPVGPDHRHNIRP